MLTATTKKGKSITLALMSKQAIIQLRQRESFVCPACKSEVIIKAGNVITPHFAHVAEVQCPEREGGEGEYHYQGKLLLYEWFKRQQINVLLEHYLPDIQQRPDLLIEVRDRQIAIEFQCAKVDPQTIYQRNIGYRRANIIPIWILGANLFKRKSTHHIQLNRFLTSFIHQFSATHPTTLFFFCPQKQQFSFVQDIIFTTNHKALAKQTFTPIHDINFYHLFIKKTFSKQELLTLWNKELTSFRLGKRPNFGQERAWRNWLYEKGLHIDYLPTYIYLPIRSQYKMKVPLWIWQSRFLLEFLSLNSQNKIFHLNEVERFLQRFIKKKLDGQLIRRPHNPIQEYLILLCEFGLLKQLDDVTFVQQQPLKLYKQIEAALDGDTELLLRFMYNEGNN